MRFQLQNPQANKRNPTRIKLKAVSPLAEKIEVTREEFNAEVAHLKELTEKYSQKWGRLRQLVANVTRWETNVANLTRTLEELKRRLPASWREYRYIRDVELPKAKERLADWTSQRETYIAEMRTELDEILAERERIARKIIKPVKNKLIAMHKRWLYKSPRGTYHDISVEMCATIIIPGTERKEDYETMLIDALEDYMYSQPGFERLTDLSQEVVGFVETPTDKPVRDVEIEAIEWWHSIPKTPQLKITDFLG
jgi:DNA repair exonuclease SbcCD ATPase subunit